MKHLILFLALVMACASSMAQGIALRATNGVGSAPSFFGTTRITQIATRPATFTASYNSNNIVGGDDNTMSTNTASSMIGAGFQNVIIDLYPAGSSSAYGGALYSFIGGGYQNEVRNANTFIVGGVQNINEGQLSIIGSGAANFIGGGGGDTADSCGIFCGQGNVIGGAIHNAFIGAGNNNLIGDQLDWCVIVGGSENVITNVNSHASMRTRASYIGAGRGNTILGTNDFPSVIVGGMFNKISGTGPAMILGGNTNLIVNGQNSFILGSTNSVAATNAGAIGWALTNSTPGSVEIGPSDASKMRVTATAVVIRNLTVTNLTLATTNSAPTGVTVGTTPPDRWFPVTNAGAVYYIPAWINH